MYKANSKLKIFIFLLLVQVNGFSQTLTQSIRGKVIDQATEVSLPGATVLLSNEFFNSGQVSNENGDFVFENVPIGRYNIEVRFVGYQPRIIPEILVNSAKSVEMEIRLIESINEIEGVTVKAQIRKDIPINQMATLSARTFTVEETRRYAGGFDDPGRMAAAFAGVAGGNPNDNALSIRGNAPKGVLWRIEGVAVPNPNHFASMLVEGGGIISLLSSQLLNNSDFFTGTFPAEYGNAISGVFDMNLRAGNLSENIWGFQIGTLGIDVFGEGPFIKGKKATYIFNYRYSTTALLKELIPFDQLPIFQDFSIKLNFPTKKAGIFSIWGIGGLDKNGSDAELDSTLWVAYDDRLKYEWDGKIGLAGLKHKLIISDNTWLSSSISASMYKFSDTNSWLNIPESYSELDYMLNSTSSLGFNSVLTHRFGKRHTNRSGFILNRIAYDIESRQAPMPNEPSFELSKENGRTGYSQVFTSSIFRFNDSFSLTSGIHSMLFFLNNSFTIEPRLALKYQFLSGNSIGFSYGLNSQIEPLPVYFANVIDINGNEDNPNTQLKPTKSHQYVLAYDRVLSQYLRLKAEIYYQNTFDIPAKPNSDYAIINLKQEYLFTDTLINGAEAFNYGFDLTLERFLQNNYYFLVTGSYIDSKYKAMDGNTYNTRWDYGFVTNFLFGKEFFIGMEKNNILGLNARIVYQGGERTHAIDVESSRLEEHVVIDEEKLWEARFPNTFYLDFTLTYRINKAKYASIIGVQLKNLLMEPSIFYYRYNTEKENVEVKGESFIFPNISYKIEF